MIKLSNRNIVIVGCCADWPELMKCAKDTTEIDELKAELLRNPVIKREKYTMTKDVELWHGVNNQEALKKLPNGKYLLIPHNDLNKLWFVPVFNHNSGQVAMRYANYAMVRVMVPFEFVKEKTTKKDGDVEEHTISYKPLDIRFERSYQVQEWFLFQGPMEVDASQVKMLEEYEEEMISLEGSVKLISKRAGKIDYPRNMYEEIMAYAIPKITMKHRIVDELPIGQTFKIDISDTEQWEKHPFIRDNWERLPEQYRQLNVVLWPDRNPKANGNFDASTMTINVFNVIYNIWSNIDAAESKIEHYVSEMGDILRHELTHMIQSLMTIIQHLLKPIIRDSLFCGQCGFEDKTNSFVKCPKCGGWMMSKQLGMPERFYPTKVQLYSENPSASFIEQHALSDIEFFTRLQDSIHSLLLMLKGQKIEFSEHVALIEKFPEIIKPGQETIFPRWEKELVKPINHISDLTPEQKRFLMTYRFKIFLRYNETLNYLRKANQTEKAEKFVRELYRVITNHLKVATIQLSKRASGMIGWWLSPDNKIIPMYSHEHSEFVRKHPEIFGEPDNRDDITRAIDKGWFRIGLAYGSMYIDIPGSLSDSHLYKLQDALEKLPKAQKAIICSATGRLLIEVPYSVLRSAGSIKELKKYDIQSNFTPNISKRAYPDTPMRTGVLENMAKDPLKEYKKKRTEETPEPKGKVEKSDNKYRFVIQEHDADKAGKHFDLRLENDEGSMSSWAIPKANLPKGTEKLLAQKTEDHPIDYASFKGKIEEGYGAGTVKIVSKSKTYKLIEWTKDTIKFEIPEGKFTLHKTDGNSWMIMISAKD